jgi:hypothetical protein
MKQSPIDLLIIPEEWESKMATCIVEKLGKVKVLYATQEQFDNLPFSLQFYGRIPVYFISKENIILY